MGKKTGSFFSEGEVGMNASTNQVGKEEKSTSVGSRGSIDVRVWVLERENMDPREKILPRCRGRPPYATLVKAM